MKCEYCKAIVVRRMIDGKALLTEPKASLVTRSEFGEIWAYILHSCEVKQYDRT